MDHDRTINRRTAMGALGAMGIGAMGASAAGARTAHDHTIYLTADDLGWDEESRRYALPDLPYAHDALEPAIDEQTMRIHHGRHHAGYVRGLNNALDELAKIRSGQGDAGLIKHWSRELAFHGSGHVNHALFWKVMAPPNDGGGGRPTGALAMAINTSFGSFDGFRTHFAAASKSVEASGWGWLAYEPATGNLLVLQTEKQQNMLTTGLMPILGVDVWEHAYYLKYQNRRGAYVDAFFDVINWPFVGELYDRLTNH